MAHSKKEVRKAIQDLQSLGCTVTETSSGHKWGRVVAPNGAFASIWSTPKNPENHAKQLVRWAKNNQK